MANSAVSVNSRESGVLILIYVCFFLSGFSALIYEICWQRLLLRVLGSTLPSVTIVLCIFMTGLGIGALVANKLARQVARPLLIYGIFELGVAVSGIASLKLFDSQPGALVGWYDAIVTKAFALQNVESFEPFNSIFWFRALFAALCLLIPTILIGSTFPLISETLNRVRADASTQGNVYFLNLVGAALGTIAAGFILLPRLGVTMTVVVASALSLSVALLTALRAWLKPLPKPLDKAPDDVLPTNKTMLPLLIIIAVNGAVSMSLEVVWSRLFALLVGSSTYAVASVFAVTISGLALGTGLFHKLSAKSTHHLRWLALISCGLAVSLFVDLTLIIQNLPWIFNVQHGLASKFDSYSAYLFERVLVISCVVLLPAVFCGGIFPVALNAMAIQKRDRSALSILYATSAFGSVIGAALSGFIFIPLLGRVFPSGIESTILLIAGVEILTAAALFFIAGNKIASMAPILLVVASFFFHKPWNQSLMSSGIPFLSLPNKAATTKAIFDRALSNSSANKLMFYREGLNTTVTVTLNRSQNIVYLKNDGKVEAALPWDIHKLSDTSDLTTHFKLGKIPVSLDPSRSKNVFVVGFGSGATCGGALDEASMKRLRVAEIEPTIFEVEHFFEQSNGNPLRPDWLQSHRIAPFCGDARMALNFSTEKYDAIISQPAEPWISGSSDLYTKEFWNLAKSKLTEHGTFCQWLQLYAIDPEYLAVLCRTFQSVFPNTYVFHFPRAGEIILLGSVEPIVPTSHPDYGNLVLLPDALSERTRLLAARYGNDRLNTDDNLLTEYSLPQKLYLSEKLIDENLKALGIGN